jgi:5'-methylthioadenosine phosphorylase
VVNALLGVIGGTSLTGTSLAAGGDRRTVKTQYGDVEVVFGGGLAFIQRHGNGVPPHRINHLANMAAMAECADKIIGVGSVGSLKRGLKPQSLVVPDDFLQFSPPTFFDLEIRHVTPGFSEPMRKRILAAASKAKIKVVDGGVYAQTGGPRFETKAEVRMLSSWADVVGMTLASEATLASELRLDYAALCSVDNMAHGLSQGGLDFDKVASSAKSGRERIERLIMEVAGG